MNHSYQESAKMDRPSFADIQSELNKTQDLKRFHAATLKWKAEGFTQEHCLEALTDIRKHEWLNEEKEDSLLDWIDLVSGFCSPQLRVW